MTTRHLRTLLMAALAALPGLPASAQPAAMHKLDAPLQTRATELHGRSRVIVQFHADPDPRVITRRGGIAGRRLAGVRAQVADVSNATLAGLAGDPQVRRVSLDRPAFATLERTGAAVGASLVSEQLGLTGRGVGIAVIDSGVAEHDDLSLVRGRSPQRRSRIAHFRDFTNEVAPGLWLSERPTDEYGHGTHVAGIVAGNGFHSEGARAGIAPESTLVALKVLDADGHGYISDVIEALDYAVSLRRTYNIRVINLSVASGVYESYHTDPLAQAARRAVESGLVVVASAGNLGANANGEPQYGGITSPGNAPWVLTVGAASHGGTTGRADDTVPTFSSRGPTWIDFSAKPDLIAPGVGIESLAAPHSALYHEHASALLSGTQPTFFLPYLSLSGTSMAAPVVAGTVALMLEANPDLTPNAVKALLQYTAEVREGEPALAQGAGLLNARGAVRMARFFANPRTGLPVPVDRIEGDLIEWGRHVIWGNVRVGGGFPLPGSNAWALDVAWGDDAVDGQPVAWGVSYDDNIVWSTYTDDNIVWSTYDDNIVWSTARAENIVWSTGRHDNIVWSTGRAENIVWSTGLDDNIVWSTARAENIVWSTGRGDNIVWSTYDDNIVWSTARAENIVWSTTHLENVVWGDDCGGADCSRVIWGARRDDSSVWGTYDDNIVWSTYDDNIVWSTYDDNIVWSTYDDNIVWSTYDDNIVWSTGVIAPTRWPAVR